MPLKLKLKHNERFIVNGAVLVNDSGNTTFIVNNYAHIMREKDVLQAADANTPTKRVYFLIQAMLMQPPPSKELVNVYSSSHAQLLGAFVKQDDIHLLHEVDRLVAAGDYYKALVGLHSLIALEAELLNVPPPEWRRGLPANSWA